MCGHPDLQLCPCRAIDALRHQENAYQNWDESREIRAIFGCPLDDTTPVPSRAPGELHSGSFEAPCGFLVVYFTPIDYPSMAHYRWHSIFDHLDKGECQDVDKCGSAVMTGTV